MTISSPHLRDLADWAHLYLASPEDFARLDHRARVLSLLSPEERQRYERFRHEPAARVFLTGRALARQVLSLYAEIPPADWVLEPDDHGRPRITAPAGHSKLEFNLSHTDRLVGLLVTAGIPCGVDIESLDRRVDPIRIAEHSFGENESEELKTLAGTALRRRFLSYWTLKEAYLKARGRGIAMRLDSVLFDFPDHPPGSIEASFPSGAEDRSGAWCFALYSVTQDQLLAVALRRGAAADLTIRFYRAQPGDPRSGRETPELLAASLPLARTTC